MNFLWMKKLFRTNKKKSTDKNVEREQIQKLEVFRPVPDLVNQQVEDVKFIIRKLLNSEHESLDYKQLNIKLSSLVKYLKQNVLLQEYVVHIYSKNQKLNYNMIVEELSQTCDEISSHLHNMVFFNNRNKRVAEMVIEINQSSKQFEERKNHVCSVVELALKHRMTYKWSILKTSSNKQLLEKFLNEIIGQKKAMALRQKQAIGILEMVQQTCGAARGRDCKPVKDDATTTDFGGDYDDYEDSFGFAPVTELRQHTPLVALAPIIINNGVGPDAPKSSSILDDDIRLMYEQEIHLIDQVD